MTTLAMDIRNACGKKVSFKTAAAVLLPCAVIYMFIAKPEFLYAAFAFAILFAYGAIVNIFFMGRGEEIEDELRWMAAKLSGDDRHC
ncbi:MAG: hypothetical protein IKT09_06685 [Synergistes sp.]|nr:hypothetical protein [Synergistes sp.]